MNNAVVYDAGVREFMNAYFSEYSITSLARAFDRVLGEFSRRGLMSGKNHLDHPQEIVKLLLALLLHTLVEYGQMEEVWRYSGAANAITSSVCNIDNYELYCERLSDNHDFITWTHMILFIISIFRQEHMISVHRGNVSTQFGMNLEGTSPAFVSNVILMFYAILMVRLVLCATYIPDVSLRYDIEACMFLTIISFYYDYVMFTKNLSRTASIRQWDMLLKQIDQYMEPGIFFVNLKLRHDLRVYIQQDNIVTMYGVVYKNFIENNRAALPKTRGIGSNMSIVIDPAINRLYDINLNSLSMIYNRWFRYIVYNKFSQKAAHDIRFIKETVKDVYGGVRDAIMLGYGVYSNIYTDKWPVISKGAGVTVGIIAFAGKTWYSFAKNRLRWGWKQLVAATVYAFPKSAIPQNQPVLFALKNRNIRENSYGKDHPMVLTVSYTGGPISPVS